MYCRCRPFSCGSSKQRFIWLERARCFVATVCLPHIWVEVGGLSRSSWPPLRRINSTYPATINPVVWASTKQPNYNFIKSKTNTFTFCTRLKWQWSNATGFTAALTDPLKSRWEKVKHVEWRKPRAVSHHLPALSCLSACASVTDLLRWCVCSQAEPVFYHMHTQYTHTVQAHTPHLTFKQQQWQLANTSCNWKSTPILSTHALCVCMWWHCVADLFSLPRLTGMKQQCDLRQYYLFRLVDLR